MEQSQLNSESLESFSSPNEKINQAMRLVKEARAESVATAKQKLVNEYEQRLNQITEMTNQAKDQVNQSMTMAEDRIKDRPFAYLAAASVIGIIIGLIMGRRK